MKPFLFHAALFGLFLAHPASSQSPFLLKDINAAPEPGLSSFPKGYTFRSYTPWDNHRFPVIGSYFFFSANDGIHGEELWKSGPARGTASLVKDIHPGPLGSSPRHFAVLNGILYFEADDGVHGAEVWRSDGTPGGTYLFQDTQPGTKTGGFQYPVVMGGKIYWSSRNGTHYDLWASDGTLKNTGIIHGGFRCPCSSAIPMGGKILFMGSDSSHGYEPWISDGTPEGTRLLKDTRPGQGSGLFFDPVVVGKKAFFFSSPKDYSSYSLFVTDGTSQGTRELKSGFAKQGMGGIPLGDKLVFLGVEAFKFGWLWVSDGTAAGTHRLADLYLGGFPSNYFNPVFYKNEIYFGGKDLKNKISGIWKTDGTAGGTKLVSAKVEFFKYPVISGGLIYFSGFDARNYHGWEFWRTDGTDAGTVEVKDIFKGYTGSNPDFLTPFKDKVVFSARDKVLGREIWESDGTPSGTRILQDIYGGKNFTSPSSPCCFLSVSGITFFTADDGIHGRELWKSDGTPAGTTMVKDIYPGSISGSSLMNSMMYSWRTYGESRPVALGGTIFFEGYSPGFGKEIWKSDGTPEGTVMVKDIRKGYLSGGFHNGCVLGDHVYFFADDGGGLALWKTDGTSTGTKIVKRGFTRVWGFAIPFKGRIYFNGSTTKYGEEPWVTDGTPEGTVILKDIYAGNDSGYFGVPVIMGGKIYFRAMDRRNPMGLWVTDGTAPGTHMVFSSTKGIGYTGLVATENRVFFEGYDPSHGYEIWASDGTTMGTRLLKDISPGLRNGTFRYPCAAGDTVFFVGFDPQHGGELWKSDGTPAGTVMVKDISQSGGSSSPYRLTPIGTRKVLFTAKDNLHGREPWISDGTFRGTKLLADIFKGPKESNLTSCVLSGGLVYFSADDGMHGREPWVWFPGATAVDFGAGSTASYPFRADDPVLGKTAAVSVRGLEWGQAAAFLLADPTFNPTPFAGGWLFFDTQVIYTAAFLTPGNGSRLDLAVPGDPALARGRVVSQAFVFPANKAFPLDSTNPVLLVMGR